MRKKEAGQSKEDTTMRNKLDMKKNRKVNAEKVNRTE
jgi:hypothetical protein